MFPALKSKNRTGILKLPPNTDENVVLCVKNHAGRSVKDIKYIFIGGFGGKVIKLHIKHSKKALQLKESIKMLLKTATLVFYFIALLNIFRISCIISVLTSLYNAWSTLLQNSVISSCVSSRLYSLFNCFKSFLTLS